ncbi:MAG TPA: hypothetical protein ENN75_01420 [candidate division Zixibacteria bacterium]|nr:hypothetical protein [candidate division Zixibacteria bacterium]
MVVLILTVAVATADTVIKFPFSGEIGSSIQAGTVVKIVGENTLAPCEEGDIPVGVVYLVETFTEEPDSYSVVSSGVVSNLLVATGRMILAGNKLVPADGGAVQAMSSNLEGHVIGVAVEGGTGGDRIKAIINITVNPLGRPKAESPDIKLYRSY